MKRKWIAHLLTITMVCTAMQTYAEAPEDGDDKTLSPYFVIEGGDPKTDRLPLKSTTADVDIVGVLAHVTVTQTYVNKGEKAINAKYVFPASTRAAVHGMKMTIGEDVIKAQIKEREQAKQDFENAKREGKSASLLEQQRPNVFSMNVANVMPGDEIDIELRYSELLTPENGIYEFVYPTVVGPRYSELTADTATGHDKWIKNPYLHEGTESPTTLDINVKLSTGIPLSELACKTHKTDIVWDGKTAADIALTPGQETSAGNREFILRYGLMGKRVEAGLLLYEGKDENFFILLAEPPDEVKLETIPPREYVFVVDVSGSMNGFPLNVSKELLRSLIGSLRKTDTFNVILFAGTSNTMSPSSVPATAENITRAIDLIDKQKGGGGTRLNAALKKALAMEDNKDISRSIVVVTDGYISAETACFQLIKKNLNNANLFAFGIGSSVNRYLIEGLARAGKGEPFVVTNKSDARPKADKLRTYIESPVLTGISVDYGTFEVYDLEPLAIPDLMAKRPLQILGKWKGKPNGIITITGSNGDGKYKKSFDVGNTASKEEHRSLRYLWARTRVAELSDYANFGQNDEAIREVTSLGLTYDLLTRYTSFIAIHDKVRNTGENAKDVVQPLPLPKGVSGLAVGGAKRHAANVSISAHTVSVPEPGFYVMLGILLLGSACMFLLSRVRTRQGE